MPVRQQGNLPLTRQKLGARENSVLRDISLEYDTNR
jgi:hypothetical protein